MTPEELEGRRAPQRRALGRGLDALFATTATAPPDEVGTEDVLVNIDPNRVAPNPEQPRQDFDDEALSTLAESIKLHGLLQPVVVERRGDGYVLIAGERRLRAAKAAGISPIPAIIRPATESARQSLELALTENLNRKDLNPIEEATAYARLADTFGLSHSAIAMRVGKARPTITNAIRLLSLSPVVQEKVATGVLTMSHGKALAALEDPAEQERFAEETERTAMNPTLLDRMIQEHLAQREPYRRVHKRIPRDLDPDDEALRAGIQQVMGLPVTMRRHGQGGELVIAWADDRDLSDLYERLGGPPL